MLHSGLIGFSSTGKTTLFKLLTKTSIGASTGSRSSRATANLGISKVPDSRLDRLVELFNPRKQIHATVEVADIVGNASMHNLLNVTTYREADALLHVVRAFHDENVPHPAETVDAIRDVRVMEDELILADLEVTERRLDRIQLDIKKGLTSNLDQEVETLRQCQVTLENGKPIRSIKLEATATKILRGFNMLSAKPLLLIINLDEQDIQQSEQVTKLINPTGILSDSHTRIVPVCAKLELEIEQLDPNDAQAFLLNLGLKETSLDRVIRATYELLGYISFFTVGKDECRAWSIPTGTVAKTAAGVIHTDLEHGFIRAEVVHYDDLINRGSLKACREHGELRLEGKHYIIKDGDVINFRFAT